MLVPAGAITIRNNLFEILEQPTPIAPMSTTTTIASLGLVGIAVCRHDSVNDCLRRSIDADCGRRTAISSSLGSDDDSTKGRPITGLKRM